MNQLATQAPAVTAAASYFAPRRLGHVNLWVADLDTSEKFYSEVCGLKVEFTEPDLVATFLGTGHTPHDLGMIEQTKGVDRYGRNGLLQLPGTIGLSAGLNHLAWELENEAQLVEAFRRLKTDGVETDITVDHQVAHSVYMFDPDGNYNEFYCDTVKDWRGVLNGPMELITSFWDPLAAEGFTEGRYEQTPELRTQPGAMLRPYRITHAVLQTADLQALRRFYCDIAGLRVVHEEEGVLYFAAHLSGYDHCLVLVQGEQPMYHHAAFELHDEAELELAVAALRAAQRPLHKEVSLPWKRSIFLKDPDGLLSEWFVKRPGRRDLHAQGQADLVWAV